MQYRMKTHQLSENRIEEILKNEQVGTLATINEDGSPYTTPIHFVYCDKKLYMHGLPAGQKIENIRRNASVSFTVYRMNGLLLDENENPCDTNTAYQSVIIAGKASLLTNPDAKRSALELIVGKYTPQLSDKPLPEKMVKGTAVIAVDITSASGKYWD